MSLFNSMGSACILLIQKIPASAIALILFCPFTVHFPSHLCYKIICSISSAVIQFFMSTSLMCTFVRKILSALISCTASAFTIAPFSITLIFFMALGSICVSSFIVKPIYAYQDFRRVGKSLSYMSSPTISVRKLLSASGEHRGEKDMAVRYPGPSDTRYALISSDLPSSPWKIVRKMLKKTRKYIRPVKNNISTFFIASTNSSSTDFKSFKSVASDSNEALSMLEASVTQNWNFSYQPFDQWLCGDDNQVFMLPVRLFPMNAENISAGYSMDLEEICDRDFLASNVTSMVRYHYTCPPTSLEALRQRYGMSRSLWGEWSSRETRNFYKTQLPLALQIDGSLGLSLQERAELASACRHALRIYSRERCHLPGRILARLYDGLRHMHDFGYWSQDGMTWAEVKQKYKKEVLRTMKAELAAGSHISDEELENRVYKIILDRACSTNAFFDKIAEVAPVTAPASSPSASSGGDVRSKQACKRRKLREVYRTLLNDLASSVPALIGGKHGQWLVESVNTGNVLHRITSTGGERTPGKNEGTMKGEIEAAQDDWKGLQEDVCCDITSTTKQQEHGEQGLLSIFFPPAILTLSMGSTMVGRTPFVTAAALQGRQTNGDIFSLSTEYEHLERMPPWSQWITDFISVHLALALDATSSTSWIDSVLALQIF